MAQTGYTPILIYSSSTTTNAPSSGNLTNSTLGSELAINITDGKLFYKDNANAVQVIAWKTTPTTAGGTGLISYTAGDLLYYASGTTLSKLAIGSSGQWLGSSGTAPQWNAPAALTKTDDTNVTLTLGGSASTALLNAASLTLGWTGTLAVSRGGTGTGTAFTAGSVVFAGASGVYTQDNANLFWDNTNNRLGIGTAAPTTQLHVSGGLTKLDYNASLMYLQQTTDTAQQAGHRFQTKDGGVYVATFAGLNTGNDQRLTIEGRGGEMAVFGQYGRSGFTSPISGYVGTILADGTTFNKAMSWYPSGGVSIGNTTDPGATNLSVTGTVRQGGALINFTNLTTADQSWGIDASNTVVVRMETVGGYVAQFILAMSWDTSNLNVRATNLSGATVGTSGASATVQPGDGRTYTISRNSGTGAYQWQSSTLATGTTSVRYRLLGSY